MVNDTLSDVLTRIRNGCLNHSQTVSIPLTRLSQQICHTLEKEGFIESFQRDTSLQANQKFAQAANSMQSEISQGVKNPLSNQKFKITKSDILIVQLKYSEKKKEGVKTENQIKNSIKKSQALSKKRSCITNLKRISKPGLRVYARHKQIPTVLGGLGILILSTPKGVMTDREARFRKVGGEILCSVW